MTEERGQRRLAAILAADVVGHSRLMAADEAGTVDRLKAMRRDLFDPLVVEHHGRVVTLMGDGTLVEFSSIVDAVRCAVAIQRATDSYGLTVPEPARIAFRPARRKPQDGGNAGIGACHSALVLTRRN
jgi:adenylate cyclase